MDRGTRLAASVRRVWFALFAVLVLAVLTGGSFYLTHSVFSRGQASAETGAASTTGGCGAASTAACPGSPADVAIAAPPTVATVPSPRAASSARHTKAAAAPHPTSTAPGTANAQPSASAAASAAGSQPPAQDGTAAAQVLALINQARSAAGLPALTVTAGLDASSSAHNSRMADGCGLSHQCPGEPSLGVRETDAGVDWTAAGENIGEGGPVADTPAAVAQMAVGLTQSMLNEQPPDDGHRLNILSSTFTHIGIAVYRDSSGTVWLTQDFSN
jgi:uncharacterized protein YkwD